MRHYSYHIFSAAILFIFLSPFFLKKDFKCLVGDNLNQHIAIKTSAKHTNVLVIANQAHHNWYNDKHIFENARFTTYMRFFSLDYSNLNEYSVELMKNFKKNNKFEIRIIDGLNFNAKQYFDILSNNWDLNEYPNEIKKAYFMFKYLALSNS